MGHKSTNPSFLSLFISLYDPLLLLQTPPHKNHILFIAATTPRKSSKKTKCNFSESLLKGERSIIAWLCNNLIGLQLLLWTLQSSESCSISLFAHSGGSSLCFSTLHVQNVINSLSHACLIIPNKHKLQKNLQTEDAWMWSVQFII